MVLAQKELPFGGGQVCLFQDDNFPTFRLLANPFTCLHQCDSRLLPCRNECDDLTYGCAVKFRQSFNGYRRDDLIHNYHATSRIN